MYKRVTSSLTNGCRIARIAELLLEQYGPERVQQVEQRSENIFYAALKDGTIIQAVVQADGVLLIHEVDEL